MTKANAPDTAPPPPPAEAPAPAAPVERPRQGGCYVRIDGKLVRQEG